MELRTSMTDEEFKEYAEEKCKWHRTFIIFPRYIKHSDGSTRMVFFTKVGRKYKRAHDARKIGYPEYCHIDDIMHKALTDTEIKEYTHYGYY